MTPKFCIAALHWLRSWCVCMLLASSGLMAAEPPVVLASIKPLALIAQAVVGERMKVDTLLPITASPHDYPLKMSDHLRLQQAAVVLWVGPELESFLAKPLAKLPAQTLIASYDLPGIHWPQLAEGHHQEDGHHHGGNDPHLWLDPRNAVLIAQALSARLAQLYPEFTPEFAANTAAFAQAAKALDQELLIRLKPVSTKGFVVSHEGYAHFVGRYNLHQLAYVALTPERRPGARHLQKIRALLENEGSCLFVEPFSKSGSVLAMATELNLRVSMLDPIGNAQVSSYSQLLNNLGEAFLTCLAQGSVERK